MLKINHLTMSYPKKDREQIILQDFSLSIKKGEILAVIGPSGCGKTSLLHCIAGVAPYKNGEILIQGERLDHKKHRIGYMPQGYGLLPWKTVYQNCMLPYRLKKKAFGEEEAAYLQQLLERMEIHQYQKSYPAFLSGGQRQRVALVRTLAYRPQLFLLDEPFSALDAIMKEQAQEAFFKAWQEESCSGMLVTHSIEEALYLGKRIIVMGKRPGSILLEAENPWFGQKVEESEMAYEAFKGLLKQKLKEGWAYEA